LAAHQLGLGAMWKSIPFTGGDALGRVLDLEAHDRFLGWVDLGHVADDVGVTRPRPSVDAQVVVRHLDPSGTPRVATAPAERHV
jgi:hypothetical protein